MNKELVKWTNKLKCIDILNILHNLLIYSQIKLTYMSCLHLCHTRKKKSSLHYFTPNIIIFPSPWQKHGTTFWGRSYTSLSSLGNEISDMPGVISAHPSKEADRVTNLSLCPFPLHCTHAIRTFFCLLPTCLLKLFIFYFFYLFTNSATSGLRGPLVLVVKNQ